MPTYCGGSGGVAVPLDKKEQKQNSNTHTHIYIYMYIYSYIYVYITYSCCWYVLIEQYCGRFPNNAEILVGSFVSSMELCSRCRLPQASTCLVRA